MKIEMSANPRQKSMALAWRGIDCSGGSSLERDDFSSNRHPARAYWWSMIFSENRFPLFGIML
jgi:hypothetical protein